MSKVENTEICKEATELESGNIKKETKKTSKKTSAQVAPTITIEYKYQNTELQTIINAIMEAEKDVAISKLAVYIQPENNIAYYVIDDKEEGKFVTF